MAGRSADHRPLARERCRPVDRHLRRRTGSEALEVGEHHRQLSRSSGTRTRATPARYVGVDESASVRPARASIRDAADRQRPYVGRPILAVPRLRDALEASPAPVVAVSPLVGGAVLKGPTHAFMAWAEQPLTSDGVVAHYGGLLDGLVADERAAGLPTLVTDVELADDAVRVRVAAETLAFAAVLAS
jgi:hypothetical protein